MIFLWLFGDVYKLLYYLRDAAPESLVVSAFISIAVDCGIVAQFFAYYNTKKIREL